VVAPRTVTRWVAAGQLVRLHPGWVTVPDLADDRTVRAHAATGYAGGPLSHMSALAVHGVVADEVTRLDVTVPSASKVRTSRWLRVHRSRVPPARRQHRVLLPDGPVLLDAAWPEVELAIELDGAAFHGSQEARERDLRRDAALAALGWLVIRFSYRRVTRDPAACRAQIAAADRSRLSVVPGPDIAPAGMSGSGTTVTP
jgi:very-short-patch-repair endonuclease